MTKLVRVKHYCVYCFTKNYPPIKRNKIRRRYYQKDRIKEKYSTKILYDNESTGTYQQ